MKESKKLTRELMKAALKLGKKNGILDKAACEELNQLIDDRK